MNEPFALSVSPVVPETRTAVRASLSGSVSFASTPRAATVRVAFSLVV